MTKENKIYTLQEFKTQDIAINIRTQEEYDNLMKFFDSIGIKWCGGDKATEFEETGGETSPLDFYAEETCITINKWLQLGYCDIKYCQDTHTIISVNQLKEYNEYQLQKDIYANMKLIRRR